MLSCAIYEEAEGSENARLVSEYLFAPFPLEGGQLQGGVLIRRRDARVADFHRPIFGLNYRTYAHRLDRSRQESYRSRVFLLSMVSA